MYHVAVYVYAGVLTALASFIMTARMNAAHPTIGVGLEFDAIAAVILGGTSFEKGRGGIVGTVIGALAVGVLRNGLNLVGIGTEWQVAIVGIVIITAVGLDSMRRTERMSAECHEDRRLSLALYRPTACSSIAVAADRGDRCSSPCCRF